MRSMLVCCVCVWASAPVGGGRMKVVTGKSFACREESFLLFVGMWWKILWGWIWSCRIYSERQKAVVEKLILNRIKKLKFSRWNWAKQQMCGIARLVRKKIMWLFESLMKMTGEKQGGGRGGWSKSEFEMLNGAGWEMPLPVPRSKTNDIGRRGQD